ncbi:MAG: Asp23/Gls24 family envelope stress response protein [Clostridiales bacterium]|nr:Asp23/Gls24 family envelope stress response protein [Clostridiales bacterium]
MAKKIEQTFHQNEDIIAAIARGTIGGILGVAPLQDSDKGHFHIDISGDRVFIDVNINADYDAKIPDLAYEIQTRIKKDIARRTKYSVEKVNVNIISVIMPI